MLSARIRASAGYQLGKSIIYIYPASFVRLVAFVRVVITVLVISIWTANLNADVEKKPLRRHSIGIEGGLGMASSQLYRSEFSSVPTPNTSYMSFAGSYAFNLDHKSSLTSSVGIAGHGGYGLSSLGSVFFGYRTALVGVSESVSIVGSLELGYNYGWHYPSEYKNYTTCPTGLGTGCGGGITFIPPAQTVINAPAIRIGSGIQFNLNDWLKVRIQAIYQYSHFFLNEKVRQNESSSYPVHGIYGLLGVDGSI